MKIVINRCYGGFSLSTNAIRQYAKLTGVHLYESVDQYGETHFHTVPEGLREETEYFGQYYPEYKRNDSNLIKVIETLGFEANGHCSRLKIIEIPDDVQWVIKDYDGVEHVEEIHRTWS